MSRYTNILNFIIEKHNGQKDKAGVPYVFHPINVALLCERESEKIVALLHDVLEDTDATEKDLISLGLKTEEIEAIKLLTKPREEDYFSYIKRVAENPIARKVKMADLTHNMDLTRLNTITEKDIRRKEKYENVYRFLKETEHSEREFDL